MSNKIANTITLNDVKEELREYYIKLSQRTMKTNEELLKDRDNELDLVRHPTTFKTILSVMDEAVKINKEKMIDDIDYHFSYMVDGQSVYIDGDFDAEAIKKADINTYLQELRNNL